MLDIVLDLFKNISDNSEFSKYICMKDPMKISLCLSKTFPLLIKGKIEIFYKDESSFKIDGKYYYKTKNNKIILEISNFLLHYETIAIDKNDKAQYIYWVEKIKK